VQIHRLVHAAALTTGLWLATPGHFAHAGDEGWLHQPYLEAPVEALDAALDDFEARMPALSAKVEGTEEARTNDVAMLLNEWGHSFDEQGRQTLINRRIYRVLTEGGVEDWDPMMVGWEPWHEARPELRVRVIHPDGEVHHLDPEAVVVGGAPEPGARVYSDTRELVAPLPALEVGAIVEQVVEIREERPYFAPGRNLASELNAYVPTATFHLWIELPEGAPFTWTLHGEADLELREDPRDGGRVRHSFTARDMPAWDDWVGMLPADVWLYPAVEFSTAASWAEVAQGYHALVQAALDTPGTAEALAPVVTAALDGAAPSSLSQAELVGRLLAELRERVRFTGLNLGEAAILPGAPAETLERSYGDAKDQATLLVALLEAVDIQARLALISTVDGFDPSPLMPGLDAFDHALVVIPGPEPTWIDPVAHLVPAGALRAQAQDRLALVAAPDAQEPARTPQSASTGNRLHHLVRIELPFEGAAQVTEQQWGSGPQGSSLRAWGSYRKAQEVQEDEGDAEDDGEHWEQTDPDDLDIPYRWTSTYDDAETGAVSDGVGWVPLYEGTIFENLPWQVWHSPGDDDEPREHDLYWAPFSVELRYEITPPPGYEMVEEPEARTDVFGPAVYERTVSYEGDTLVVVSTIDWPTARITPEQFAEAQPGLVALAEGSAATATYKHSGLLAWEAGEIEAAVQAYRAQVQAWPDEPQPKVDLAEFLVTNTLAPAGRAMVDQAVAQARDGDPDELARVLYMAGWTYTHDDLGTYSSGGYDREAALRVWREAREAAPDNPKATLGLAVTLRYDAHGMLLEPDQPERAEGMELLLTTKDMPGSDATMADLVLRSLIEDERFAEALEAARAMPSTDATRSTILVCLCLLEGADAAMASPDWQKMDRDTRTMAVGMANLTLIGTRRYSEAIAMLEAIPSSGAMALQAQQMMPLMRQLRPWREQPFDARDPAEVAKRFMIMSAASDTSQAEMMALFVRGTDTESVVAHGGALKGGAQLGMDEMGVAGMSIDFLPDMLAVLSEAKVVERHGKDAHVSIAMLTPTADGPANLEFLLVRKGRQWKIVSGETLLRHQSAAEALARLEAGKPDEALRWLGWLNDGSSTPPADPWDGALMTHLFHELNVDDLDALHLAATAVLAGGGHAPQAVAELERLLAQETDPHARVILGRCLSWAHEQADDDEALVAHFTQLREEYPDIERPFHGLIAALWRLERHEDRKAVLEAQLEREPDDVRTRRYLAAAHARLGDRDQARILLQALDREGEANEFDYNELAWWDIMDDRVDDTTIQHAERANELGQFQDSATLHTLACAVIDQGEVQRTLEILQYAMQSNGYDASNMPEHWRYVAGRVAEGLGEPELALDIYQRLAADEAFHERDTYTLVARRIEALEASGDQP
jgi:tetratricopeptide (TPR) repeat protein